VPFFELQVLAAQFGNHFVQTLHLGQQGFFAGTQRLLSARSSSQGSHRRSVGDVLPLVEQCGTDLVLVAHLADAQVRVATFLENLEFGHGRELAPSFGLFVFIELLLVCTHYTPIRLK
jgi:hypothetical protein